MAKRGRIRLYFEGEERDLAASSKRAEAAIGGVDDATKRLNKTTDEQSVAVDRVNKRNFELTSSTKSVRHEQDSLVKSLHDVNIRFTSMRNLIGLIKWPALITGAGYAAQGLGTAAAGATALTSALGPLSGALTAYPALLGAVGQAAGVLALTQMGDLKEALGGNEEAMKRLSPQAKRLLGVIKGMEPEFKRLRSSVQERLFEGLSLGVKVASSNFGVLQRILGRTAGTLGHLAQRAGALLGSKGFGRDLQTVGEGNARVLGRMGVAGLKLSSALRHVMVAAQPFLMWLTGSAVKLADWVDGAAAAGRESGRMAGFFERSREVMERLSSIAQSLGAGLLDIGHAAAPLGRQILAALDTAAQGFEDWTSSIEGKNALKDYFLEAKPGIFEMGRLIRDVAGAFLQLSTGKGFVTMTHEIRTQLVPVLQDVIETTTTAFGPHLVSALVQIAKLFGHIAGTSGPLTRFVDTIGNFAGFANTLLDTVPGLEGVVVTLVGIVAVSKAMKFAAAITGVTTLVDLFKKLRTAAAGAAVAEQAASTPGLFGGRGKGGGIKGKLGGLLGLGASAAMTVGPLGMMSGPEVASVGAGGRAAGGLLAAAPAAGPWLAVAAAVAATAAGFVLLYKNSKTFRDMVAPVGQAATDAFGKVKAELAPLGDSFSELGKALGGNAGMVGEIKKLYGKVRGPLEAVAGLLRSVWLNGIRSIFTRASETIRGFGQMFSGQMQALRGVIEVITGILTLKFDKAWDGVKNIFGGGVKAALGYMRMLVAPVTATAKAVGGVLSDVFGGAWDKVKSIFEDGANAVIGFVQKIADVINLIPGVPDIEIPAFGGGDKGGRKGKAPAGPQGPVGVDKRYTGGPINRPMAIVGEEAPQHPEWVIATNPRYRKNNIAYWMQAGRDLGVPGFFSGGDIVSAAKGAVSAAGGAIGGIVNKGAGYFIGKLPKPDLPPFLGGLGAHVISGVTEWIKDGFQSKKLGKFTIGPGALYTGPPANMKQLGDNRYVDSHTLAVTAFLDKMFGLSMSSGFRSVGHNAAIGGAAGSLHTHGTPANPGATDSVGPMGRMRAYIAFAKQHVAGLKEAMVDNVGNGWNAHLGFFAAGGKIDWSKLVGSSWDNDELATLAHIVGMASPGYMAQKARGESRGNAHAVGHDEGGTEGLGLWQITTGYNDALIAKYGGRAAMFDPLLNARAAAEILASQGVGAWYAPATGPTGHVDQGLAQKIRDAMAGKAIGGDGDGTKARDFKYGLAPAFGVSLTGLPAGKLPAGAEALPASIQGLLRAPGLTGSDRIGIGQVALSQAEETDAFEDDVAAANFLKPLLEGKRGRLSKELRKVNRSLRKGGENEKQRRRNLKRQRNLRGQLVTTRGELRGLNEKVREAEPTERDFADADLARAESTPDRGDDIAVLQHLEEISRKELQQAEKSGDPREIAEATRNLKASADALRDATPTAEDFASRDLALAELTAGSEDDHAALLKLKDIAQAQLNAALQTADPRDDIEAAQRLKQLTDALENTAEQLRQREDFEKERLEVDKRLAALAETQGPAFAASLLSWIDGSIGGPTQLRHSLPSTPGVAAGYS